jgi:4-aminobutyrate aminotransferase-like enzyme/murein DD-endopeptidase MepM/ murein hydrolase activator NlpD
LKNASRIIHRNKEHIVDPEKTALIEYFLGEFEKHVLPVLSDLRISVVHNDANDYNLIIDKAGYPEERSIGIIDFGDMVATHTIFELAVATAYAILGKSDPIIAASSLISGYHSIFPLTEQELELLFPSICARLALSVTLSAYQQTLEPDNEYLKISEAPAWKLLHRLRTVHPRFATYAFRHACQMLPCPKSSRITTWLRENTDQVGSILDIDLTTAPVAVIDLSLSSPELTSFANFTSIEKITQRIFSRITAAKAKVGIGRYNEARMFYIGLQYRSPLERRTVHTGVDLFLPPGTPVRAPLDGVIHSFLNNRTPFDYGPTIILEHTIKDSDLTFFTLYGHLSVESLEGLAPGKPVSRGEKLAEVGTFPSNGGWPPHLHFQLITDLLDNEGDFPGVVLPSQRDIWLSISPDPNLILQIPPDQFPEARLTCSEILRLREKHLGGALSVHYQEPLTIVRGYMQYLFDEMGRVYLDAVNNVPHVGHSNPRVVRALSEQAALLYTNSRYLHENLVRFAKRLCATLPEPLSVCFFVNSGSEANELALRLAHTHTQRRDLVVVDGGYHGSTGTLIGISPYKFNGPGGAGAPPHVHTVTMPDVYRGKYRRDDPNAGRKYAQDLKRIIQQLKSEGKGVAAFICEPMQGCGGQIIFPPKYLQEAFRHIRKAGGVCIVDEVQVGFGRVGTHFWGFQTQDVVPDIVTMGKPIGNGHPLGAVVTTPEIAKSFTDTGMEFFSTTGGNPVSCAVGLAVLDELETRKLQKHAHTVGKHLLERLQQLKTRYPLIGDVRGMGLFIGVELVLDPDTLTPAKEEAVYILERMKDEGILIGVDGPLGNVLKIKPPMVFTQRNADFLVQTLEKILSEDRLQGQTGQFLP